MHKLIAIPTLLVFTGCASVTGSKFQPVMVQTVYSDDAVAGAGCTLTNAAGQWAVTTPGSVRVQKSFGDMLIECKMAEGISGQLAIPSKANLANWGNLLLGGPVGLVVDGHTGAGYDYPSVVAVTLGKTLDTVAPEPASNQPPGSIDSAPTRPSTPPNPVVAPEKGAETHPAKPTIEKPDPAPQSKPDAMNDSNSSPSASPAPVYTPKRASSYWE